MSTVSVVRRVQLTLVLLVVAVVGAVLLRAPLADGGFTAGVTNGTNSLSSAGYFTCAAAASGETSTKATFAWPLNDSSGLVAADSTGNGATGRYSLTGVTYGSASTACPRDANSNVVTLNGSSGYVVSQAQYTNPQTFTVELWFSTTVANGKLIGFGDSNSLLGLTSVNYDRQVYFDSTGALRFGVYPGAVQTIAAPAPTTPTATYADSKWHYVAASLSSAGMKLYVDGTLVASNSAVTGAQVYNGYWHVGFDNLDGWTNTPSNRYFRGSVGRVAVYSYALSAAQVSAHYRAGLAS